MYEDECRPYHGPFPPNAICYDPALLRMLEQSAEVVRQRKWDRFFLGMATYVASASKDPSTKVGAVIARPDNTVASVGYNGFPRGMTDSQELYDDRDTKYSRIVHAEMNAILNAHGPVSGFTLYCTFPPCDRCAVFIVQAGIKRIVAHPVPEEARDRWAESLNRTYAIFRDARVKLDFIPRDPE